MYYSTSFKVFDGKVLKVVLESIVSEVGYLSCENDRDFLNLSTNNSIVKEEPWTDGQTDRHFIFLVV